MNPLLKPYSVAQGSESENMPVMKKEIELDDGKKIWVRQASGMERLKITNIQGRAFRKMRHAGDPTEWTDEQNEEFANIVDEMGGGVEAQMEAWIKPCILDENVDINLLTFDELTIILQFVRGDDEEGAVHFQSS